MLLVTVGAVMGEHGEVDPHLWAWDAFIVANMSHTSVRSSSSQTVTGRVLAGMTALPHLVMGRTLPPSFKSSRVISRFCPAYCAHRRTGRVRRGTKACRWSRAASLVRTGPAFRVPDGTCSTKRAARFRPRRSASPRLR